MNKKDSAHFYPTPKQFFEFVHRYTERMAIKVIIDNWLELKHIKGLKRMREFYLTVDLNKDKDRILKYYRDAPLWNLHVEWSTSRGSCGDHYCGIGYTLVANVHFSDIMESYLKEKDDERRGRK